MKRSFMVCMPDGSTRTYTVENRVTKLGRASDNDIVLVDANRSVSRWHAAITANEDGFLYIEDLNSKNGTEVNGQKVEGAVQIRPEDAITLGRFKVSLREEVTERFSVLSA